MGLQELIKKHGGKFDKKGWFTLKEPTLEDAKRIAAKGELEELDHEDSSIEAVKAELKKIERKKDIILEDRMEGLMSKELYQKEVKALNEQAEELELRIKSDRMYDETIKQEWSRYNKYIKRVLALDPDSLNNGDLKQVYNKIYVGVADVEGKARPRKYLIFSYSLMGYRLLSSLLQIFQQGLDIQLFCLYLRGIL